MLCVVGDVVEDVVVHLQAPPERATDTPRTDRAARGGGAANVAVAAARAGCPTRFIGRVGDDQVGQQLVDDLEDDGVDVRVQRGPAAPGPSSCSSSRTASARCCPTVPRRSSSAPSTGRGWTA